MVTFWLGAVVVQVVMNGAASTLISTVLELAVPKPPSEVTVIR